MLARRSVTWPGSRRARLLAVVVLGLLCPGLAAAQEKVPAAHEKLEKGSLTDDLGIFVPVPASHPGRRYPASDRLAASSTFIRTGGTRRRSSSFIARPSGDPTAARSWSSCKTT